MNLMRDGELHDQEWARLNMSKFHHSIVYIVSQCNETWPLKSKPRSSDTYVCLQCSRDEKGLNSKSVKRSFPLKIQRYLLQFHLNYRVYHM